MNEIIVQFQWIKLFPFYWISIVECIPLNSKTLKQCFDQCLLNVQNKRNLNKSLRSLWTLTTTKLWKYRFIVLFLSFLVFNYFTLSNILHFCPLHLYKVKQSFSLINKTIFVRIHADSQLISKIFLLWKWFFFFFNNYKLLIIFDLITHARTTNACEHICSF